MDFERDDSAKLSLIMTMWCKHCNTPNNNLTESCLFSLDFESETSRGGLPHFPLLPHPGCLSFSRHDFWRKIISLPYKNLEFLTTVQYSTITCKKNIYLSNTVWPVSHGCASSEPRKRESVLMKFCFYISTIIVMHARHVSFSNSAGLFCFSGGRYTSQF